MLGSAVLQLSLLHLYFVRFSNQLMAFLFISRTFVSNDRHTQTSPSNANCRLLA